MQVRAFLQLGKNAGKDSISVAVDVATDLMEKKSITPKFTTDELRDMSQSKCGARGQSRTFHKLDQNLQLSGGHHIHKSACDSPTGVSGGSPTHSE